MKRGILVGGACFLLGAISLALAQTTAMRPDQFVAAAWTWTGVQTFADGKLSVGGATSGNSIIKAPATGGGTVTLPTGTGTLGFGGGTQTLTLISTQTASSSSNLAFTGLDTSASGVNTLFLDCNAIQLSALGDGIDMQFGTGSTPTYQTTGYFVAIQEVVSDGTTSATDSSGSAGAIRLTFHNASTNSAGKTISLKAWISNLSNPIYKNVSTDWSVFGNTVFIRGMSGGTWGGATTAVTALKLYAEGGATLNSGQCSLYKLTP